jgi:hypothetical protein
MVGAAVLVVAAVLGARAVITTAVLAVRGMLLVVLLLMVELVAGVGALQAVIKLLQLLEAEPLAVKQLTLTATQSLGQAATQQEFTGAYLDLFNF